MPARPENSRRKVLCRQARETLTSAIVPLSKVQVGDQGKGVLFNTKSGFAIHSLPFRDIYRLPYQGSPEVTIICCQHEKHPDRHKNRILLTKFCIVILRKTGAVPPKAAGNGGLAGAVANNKGGLMEIRICKKT